MATFEVGDAVMWTTVHAGIDVPKVGTIFAIVPRGRLPKHVLSMEELAAFNTTNFQETTLARRHDSFVVSVPRQGKSAKPRLYWPIAKLLRRVDTSPNDSVAEGLDVGTDFIAVVHKGRVPRDLPIHVFSEGHALCNVWLKVGSDTKRGTYERLTTGMDNARALCKSCRRIRNPGPKQPTKAERLAQDERERYERALRGE